MQIIQIIFKNSAVSSQKTQRLSIAKMNKLMLFRKIIVVYCKNHTKSVNTLCGKIDEILVIKQVVKIVTMVVKT